MISYSPRKAAFAKEMKRLALENVNGRAQVLYIDTEYYVRVIVRGELGDDLHVATSVALLDSPPDWGAIMYCAPVNEKTHATRVHVLQVEDNSLYSLHVDVWRAQTRWIRVSTPIAKAFRRLWRREGDDPNQATQSVETNQPQQ